MPGGMPGNVEKGFILEKLDQVLTNASKDDLTKFKDELESGKPIADLAKQYLKVRDIDQQHLKQHWFNPRSGVCWWLEHQRIEPIVRYGLMCAIELRLANMDRSVDSYWICAGHSMEVVSCLSGKQITLLIMTPTVPVPRYLEEPVDNHHYEYGQAEAIWVCRPPAGRPAETDQVGGSITGDHVMVRPRRLQPKTP